MTLFAAMFSVGTIVLKCVELAATHNIDYRQLSSEQRQHFMIEAQRTNPTVTTVHRIVEEPEDVEIRGRHIRLQPGDEVCYPFVCIHQNPQLFKDPETFRIERPAEERDRVLSWSVGPHACPAKELSILSTVVMLDALSERYDLRELRLFNPEF